MRSPSPFRGQHGLTLLELLVALAVTGLIVAVLGGVLRLGSRAWERGEQWLEAQQRNRDGIALLNQEIRSAYPYQVKVGDKLVYLFQGSGARVRFISALSDPSPSAPVPFRLVTFSVMPKQGLVVLSAPLRGGGLPEDSQATAHVLDGRVQELRLRYLGPSGWTSSWEAKGVAPTVAAGGSLRGAQAGAGLTEPAAALPQAVEVSLVFAASRVLGPFTIPVFAGGDLKKSNPAGGRAS